MAVQVAEEFTAKQQDDGLCGPFDCVHGGESWTHRIIKQFTSEWRKQLVCSRLGEIGGRKMALPRKSMEPSNVLHPTKHHL